MRRALQTVEGCNRYRVQMGRALAISKGENPDAPKPKKYGPHKGKEIPGAAQPRRRATPPKGVTLAGVVPSTENEVVLQPEAAEGG